MLQDFRRVGKVYEIQGLMKILTLPDRLIAKKVDSARALIGRKYLICYIEGQFVRIACS
jgi:hypothetical protein